MKKTIVILAAGIGSRYKGLKQLDPVGPGGNTLMDYTIYDALEVGFDKVVIVIRRETEDKIREHIKDGAGHRAEVVYVHQDLYALPRGFVVTPGRRKPWGTGQAVLVAARHLDRPFVVANADDFYGRAALASLDEFLDQPSPDGLAHWAMIGYRLGDTLPPKGEVSRALCVQDIDGWLVDLEEVHGVKRDGAEAAARGADGRYHLQPLDTLVSMNLWGFTLEALRHLEREFRAFLDENPNVEEEFYLPDAVVGALSTGNARVAVRHAGGRWAGMTSPGDRENTVEFLRELVDKGVYPEKLWK
jgi:hypothetical protein